MSIILIDAERRILDAIIDGENIEHIKIFLDIAEKLITPQLKIQNDINNKED